MTKIKDTFFIILGAGLFSFGLTYLLIPAHLYEGGLTGINLIIFYLFGIQPSLMNAILNIPIFLAGWHLLGKQTLLYSLIGTFSMSIWLAIFEKIKFDINLEGDLFLIVILAGLIMGLGLGLIFRLGGTTGGGDIVARIIHKYFPQVTIGRAMLAIDICVLLVTILVAKDLRLVLYTMVFVFIASRMIDLVGDAGYGSKGIMIMTTKSEELATAIDRDIERGITFIKGQGFYSRTDLNIVYTVIDRQQLAETKALIHQIDPTAFITITDASEVLGQGFTLDENNLPLQKH
ncbi:YitT family protein [Streptococcus sp. DD13]|uniref:YitT family protein n=1 Tax=Streptococcus sp. DD13 TaxID=1777881 RepID=UPI00082E0F3A|nr:YitT family protein [Streptococcus sp. DD13]